MTLVWSLFAVSLIALAVKIILIFVARNILSKIDFWIVLLVMFALCQNIAELLLFLFVNEPDDYFALVFLKIYYGCSLVMLVSFFKMCNQLAGTWSLSVAFCTVTLFIVATFTLVIPDLALSGVKNIGYTVTRVAGPYYWVQQFVILTGITVSALLLVNTAFHADNWSDRRKARAILIGSAPVLLGAVIVIGLMQLGISINATLVATVTVNIALIIIIYSEYETILFKFLSFVPMTPEFHFAKLTVRAASKLNSSGLQGAAEEFEDALINETLKKYQGNKSASAKALGVSRTTLRRKLS